MISDTVDRASVHDDDKETAPFMSSDLHTMTLGARGFALFGNPQPSFALRRVAEDENKQAIWTTNLKRFMMGRACYTHQDNNNT